jgi:hypothetical protein
MPDRIAVATATASHSRSFRVEGGKVATEGPVGKEDGNGQGVGCQRGPNGAINRRP